MATWFTYDVCRDVAATRRFYGELVGLTTVWDRPDDVAFVHDCVQLSFHEDAAAPQHEGWTFQPGWCLGQLDDIPPVARRASISIALSPGAFRAAVTRLREAGIPALRPEPFWVGYWSYVVADPSGRTVELSDPTSSAPGTTG